MTHVLVTGGTGFIGHHLVLDLLEWTDWTFTVVDAMGYAGDPAKLLRDPRFDPARVDVVCLDLETEAMPHNPRATHPDVIVNLAAESHVDRSIADPAPFIMRNVSSTVNMLEWAKVTQPRLFIQFSTDEVYGPVAPGAPGMAEWSPIIPSNPYAASKAAQEAVAIAYWRTYGVPVVLTNTTNVFGPRQHPEKFIPTAVGHLRAGLPVPVHADQRPSGPWVAGSRCYTYVRNVSWALEWIIRGSAPGMYPFTPRPDRWNIVGDREMANDEMVYAIADIMGVRPHILYVDVHAARPGHDRRYALDGSKLRAVGWTPRFTFDDGLDETVHDMMRVRATDLHDAHRGYV